MIIIYHKNDFDGVCSGRILQLKYPDANMIGYHYGEHFDMDWIMENENVIMADVSLPMEKMEEIAIKASSFVWIDHHESAFKQYCEYFGKRMSAKEDFLCLEDISSLKYYYDSTKSACEMCWEYCWESKIPLGVSLLGRYDVYDQSDLDYNWELQIFPFQYGMREYGLGFDDFPSWVLHRIGNEWDLVQDVINKGNAILTYQKQQNATQIKRMSFDAFIGWEDPDGSYRQLRAICCVGVPFNSISFESVWDEDKYDIMVPLSWKPDEWSVGLYSPKKEVNCSEIAMWHGGGGHPGAAGCRTKDIFNLLAI